MENFGDKGVSDVIALAALVFSLLSFAVTFFLDGQTRKREARIESRDNRVEKSTAYLTLETASSEIFKYEAEHAEQIDYLRSLDRPAQLPDGDFEARQIARNFYFQSLNLFEVCSRFRREGVIYRDVYASWVAWFWEIATDWYFREIWVEDIRPNYTREVRDIFDLAWIILRERKGQADAEEEFYVAVGKLVDERTVPAEDDHGSIIANWPSQLASWPTWDFTRRELGPRNKGPQPKSHAAPPEPAAFGEFRFAWDRGVQAEEAAAFAARVIGAQESYISHGEIQTALSTDGETWVGDLEARYAADFADPGDRDMLVARNGRGTIAAIGIVAWHLDSPARYAVIEDMAVAPELRGKGLGQALLDRLVERIRERGADWTFLESGLRNKDAHEFFERRGFSPISHVFARRLR